MGNKYFIGAYSAPPPQNWDEHRTPGYKNDNFINDEQYALLEEGGFTHAIAMYEYGQERAILALETAERHNIKYIVRDWDLYGANPLPEDFVRLKPRIDQLKGYRAFDGYFIDDEPNASRFKNIGNLKPIYDKLTGGADFFVNLLPTYANPSEQWGTESYEHYIDEYIRQVKPDYVMFDHYPIMCTEERELYISPEYLYNLEVVAERCNAAHIPFRSFVQALAYGNLPRDIDGEDIFWQTYTNLAFGSAGTLYFTYWTPLESHRPTEDINKNGQESLITKDGRPTERYEAAKRLHAEIHSFEEEFLQYRWENVLTRVGAGKGKNACFEKLKHAKTQDGRIEIAACSEDLLVGLFVNAEGKRAYMVVNFSDPHEKRNNDIALRFTGEQPKNIAREGSTKHLTLDGDKVRLKLSCGEGVFLF